MSLIWQLVKKKVLDKPKATALEYEVKTSGKKEEEVILEQGIVAEDFLFGLKSQTLKIPLKTVSADEVSLEALEIIPEESSKYYQMIPLVKEDNHLEIGMVFPEDLKAREALEFLARQSKFSYQIFLITLSNFKDLLKKYRSLRKEVTRALEELEQEMKDEKKKKKVNVWARKAAEVERVVEEAPISKVVAVVLRHAVDGKASDIHIEPSKDRVRVRFRLDGILHASLFLPLKILPSVVARIKILSNLKIDETRVPQDGRFSTTIGEKGIDFRVSTFPTTLGEKAVIRILDSSKRKADFASLGVEGRNLKIMQNALKKTYGMILSTGPTGAGKSTTLYAILGVLNKEEVNVMTLEDPVEYFIEGVNQSQVRPEIKYTFATGLRSMVRQDPDIMMVGEIRDEETASLAIHAALTGHVVLSTLHTSNAIGVIPRLVDMGVEPFLLPPTINVMSAQRLVRRFCRYCKKKVKADPEVEKKILNELAKFPVAEKKKIKVSKPLQIFKTEGCKRCNNVGYSGRIGIFEFIEMTDELAKMILRKPSEGEILEEANRQGMITMKQDGILKVLGGETSLEEILRVAEEK